MATALPKCLWPKLQNPNLTLGLHRKSIVLRTSIRLRLMLSRLLSRMEPVSYTHLDVYKRQVLAYVPLPLPCIFTFISFPFCSSRSCTRLLYHRKARLFLSHRCSLRYRRRSSPAFASQRPALHKWLVGSSEAYPSTDRLPFPPGPKPAPLSRQGLQDLSLIHI